MYPKEVNAETRDICTPMFIAALFTIAKIQVFIYGQVDKQMWSILKWKMDEPWGHYAKWNKPVTKKDKSCVILLMWNTQRGPSLGDRKWASGCHGLRGRRGSPLKGVEFQFFLQVSLCFYKRKKVLEMSGGDASATLWIYLIPLNCTLKEGCNGNFNVMSILPQKNLGE